MARLMELVEEKIRKENGIWYLDDVDVHSDKAGVDVSVWFSSLCFNVGYYPIIQVDDNEGNMIDWKSGPEDSSIWLFWIAEILEDYLDIDDWWYIY